MVERKIFRFEDRKSTEKQKNRKKKVQMSIERDRARVQHEFLSIALGLSKTLYLPLSVYEFRAYIIRWNLCALSIVVEIFGNNSNGGINFTFCRADKLNGAQYYWFVTIKWTNEKKKKWRENMRLVRCEDLVSFIIFGLSASSSRNPPTMKTEVSCKTAGDRHTWSRQTRTLFVDCFRFHSLSVHHAAHEDAARRHSFCFFFFGSIRFGSTETINWARKRKKNRLQFDCHIEIWFVYFFAFWLLLRVFFLGSFFSLKWIDRPKIQFYPIASNDLQCNQHPVHAFVT